ncbi:MAG: hydrolase [Planctomycetota bacterium]|nr:MAG: hydrolase [Planctomycetota bacterium]
MNPLVRLDREQAQLVVVDVQDRLLPLIHEHEQVVAQCARMIRAARVLEIPMLVSEQYPAGLGHTTSALLDVADGASRAEKSAFSVCRDEATFAPIKRAARPQVLLVGIEAHVCVLQSALDLLASGRQPFVLADAVSSRRPLDRETAFDRMRAAGVVVTTVESAIFELLEFSGTPEFKQILPIVK